MKRFYRIACVAPGRGGHAVLLDDKPVRTPLKRPLELPASRLAEAIAAEWQAQGETIDPPSMPLTRLAATALDRVGPDRSVALATLEDYAGSDLLCYRADRPAELAERQAAEWQPLLDWAMTRHDALLVTTEGLLPVDQPPEAVAALRRACEALDDFRLTAVHAVTQATGSLVLALALAERRLDAEATFRAGLADDLYSMEVWGDDPEARKRRDALRAEIDAADRLLALLDE